tara:strand:+ start:121 stop:339 length:219 start_codon:yes stop_codon:yes gene_type:complete
MAKNGQKWPKMGQKWPFFDHFWTIFGPIFGPLFGGSWPEPKYLSGRSAVLTKMKKNNQKKSKRKRAKIIKNP